MKKLLEKLLWMKKTILTPDVCDRLAEQGKTLVEFLDETIQLARERGDELATILLDIAALTSEIHAAIQEGDTRSMAFGRLLHDDGVEDIYQAMLSVTGNAAPVDADDAEE